ncbi:hypothetical protein TOTORO_00870 [Serratia phage vB_SmaS-Totoro]|nr:hypothetical protein TOTORO_00870 [Serratia phage vB_SmaS-Totoro]
MKTTVKQLSDNTYVITFGIFESAKAMNLSYRDMQTVFGILRSQYTSTDMYGRFVGHATRRQYHGQDHYDLAVNPDYVIRAGGLRLDSEEAIVSVKLEVVDPKAFGTSVSDFELGFNNWGWLFVPRCFAVCDVDDQGFSREVPIRAYIGLPEEKPVGWFNKISVDYRTIDIWFTEDTEDSNAPTEDPAPAESVPVATKIVVDKTQAELVKLMLAIGYNFTMKLDGADVEFQVTDKADTTVDEAHEKRLKDWIESFDFNNVGSKYVNGYLEATFTPEQPKVTPTDPTQSMWGPE